MQPVRQRCDEYFSTKSKTQKQKALSGKPGKVSVSQ